MRRLAKTKKRKRVRVVGRIDSTSTYTPRACLKYGGLGRDMLRQARMSGIVKAYQRGTRIFYLGSELIAWIVASDKEKQDARD